MLYCKYLFKIITNCPFKLFCLNKFKCNKFINEMLYLITVMSLTL